jgi:hypothetical protein
MTITTLYSQHRPGRRAAIVTATTVAIAGLLTLGLSVRHGSDPSPEQSPGISWESRSYAAELAAASPLELAAAFGNTVYDPFGSSTPEELAAAFGHGS